jgi:hypothetical protein
LSAPRTTKASLLGAMAILSVAGGACSEPAGLRVDVAFGDYKSARSVTIAITANPDGFVSQPPTNAGGGTVTTEDVDGNGTLELVARFLGPFDSGTLSFRVATGNQIQLDMSGEALAFSDTQLVAGADAATTLPAGGSSTLSLALATRTSGTVGPGTRATDLLTAGADLTIKGPKNPTGTVGAQASAIALCNLDGEAPADLVVGAPQLDPGLNIGPTGAVFVVFGAGADTAPINLDPSDSAQFSFHGAGGGDQLGAAVGCADLDGDGLDDLIVSAPNANGGTGRVYAVLGRTGLKRTSIDLASTDHLPDATWTTGVANAHLGSAVYAANLGSKSQPILLLSAPGDAKVHLLASLPSAPAPLLLETAPHTTFAHVRGAALGAGDLHDVGDAVDVVVGDPSYLVSGDIQPSGAVYVFGGLTLASPTAYDATATDATGPSTMIVGPTQSTFGASVIALDTTGNLQDLFVGAPGDGGDGRGRVYVYAHGSNFFNARERDYMRTSAAQIEMGVANARFGSALGATRTGTASWRLLVGSPNETRGQRNGAGAAYLLDSGADRRFPILEVLYGANAGDHLGSAVTGGQVNADAIGDLVTVAPYASGTEAGSGVAYAQYGRP